MGAVVVAHGLSCSTACGIFLDQGSNLCPLALAGGFLTTVSPGKFQVLSLKESATLVYKDIVQDHEMYTHLYSHMQLFSGDCILSSVFGGLRNEKWGTVQRLKS